MTRRVRWILFSGLLLTGAASDVHAGPLRNLNVGDKALPIELNDASGKLHRLSDFKEAPVTIVFWRPKQELSVRLLDDIDSLAARYSSKGAVFLSIAHIDSPEEVEKSKKLDPSIKFLFDPERVAYGAYGLFVQPTTIILDKDHKIVALYASYRRGLQEILENDIRTELGLEKTKEPAKAPPIKDPQDPVVNFARKLIAQGRAGEALSLLEKKAAPKPTVDRILVTADALMKLQRWKEARQSLEKLLEVQYEDRTNVKIPLELPLAKGKLAATHLGHALMKEKRYEDAEEWLKAAAYMNPDPNLPRYYLGQLYEATGEKEKALVEYNAVLKRLLED